MHRYIILSRAVFHYMILYSRAISTPYLCTHARARGLLCRLGRKVRSTAWDELWSRFFIQWDVTWVASGRETCRGVNRSAFRRARDFREPLRNYVATIAMNRSVQRSKKKKKRKICGSVPQFIKTVACLSRQRRSMFFALAHFNGIYFSMPGSNGLMKGQVNPTPIEPALWSPFMFTSTDIRHRRVLMKKKIIRKRLHYPPGATV